MSKPTRREMITGVVAAGAGVFLGREIYDSDIPVIGSTQHQILEKRNSAAPSAGPDRWGTHRTTWSMKPTESIACISFDDGPDPQFTPRVLKALDDAGVKATFMAMGWNAQHHPSLLKEVVAAGHDVGNHTWSHEDLAFQTAQQTRDQIVKGKEAIEAVVQVPLVGFRPPRGEMNGAALAVCAELGYDTWLWSMTRGPGGPGKPQDVIDWVGNKTQVGDIIDLHDSIGWWVRDRKAKFAKGLIARRNVEIEALPQVLAKIAERGIKLVTISELVANAQA